MRLSRIHTPQVLAVGEIIELERQAGHYLANVLRLSAGDTVTLFNGNGMDFSGRVQQVQRHRVRVMLLDKSCPKTESDLKVSLIQAISRGERMDYTVQKAVELGVYAIQPLFSSRVEVRLDDKRRVKRLTHWRRVAISACEQSGRAVVPQILEPVSLGDWLLAADTTQALVLDPDAGDKLSACTIDGDCVSMVVGPEGGFNRQELNEMLASGITAVSLGPRVLRTESAGAAAIAVLQMKAGDF